MADARPGDAFAVAAPPLALELSSVLSPAEAERLTDALARILLAAARVRAARARDAGADLPPSARTRHLVGVTP